MGISSRAFVFIYLSSDSSSVDESSIESKIDSYYNTLSNFPTKSLSSNCAKVIIFPVFSCDDSEYRIHKTDVCVASASEYGHDMFANAIENSSLITTSCEETIFVY